MKRITPGLSPGKDLSKIPLLNGNMAKFSTKNKFRLALLSPRISLDPYNLNGIRDIHVALQKGRILISRRMIRHLGLTADSEISFFYKTIFSIERRYPYTEILFTSL